MAVPFASPLAHAVRKQRRFVEEYLVREPATPSWTTATRVLRREEAFLLREVPRASAGPERLPVLVVPPEVNHSAIVDYGPGQSLVAAFSAAGFDRVAAMEWRSASPATRARDIDDSVEAILECAEVLGGSVHLVGVCQGGWECAIAAALRPDVTASVTLVAAPVDFSAGEGFVKHVARATPMLFYEAIVAATGGMARGGMISHGFDLLLPFERFVLKPLSVWNHLDDEAWMERFDALESWYRTPKDLPGPLYLRAVKELFKENRLVRGELRCLGQRVDLRDLVAPLCLVAGAKDHITPATQVWATERHVGSTEVFRLETSGGHVGAFIGRSELRDRWPAALRWLRGVDDRCSARAGGGRA